MKLYFKNPHFDSGLNSTVRNGLKWASVPPGTKLEICKTDEDNVLTEAILRHAITTKAGDLSNEILFCQHDPATKTVDGLNKILKDCYNESYDPETSDLTILFFWVD